MNKKLIVNILFFISISIIIILLAGHFLDFIDYPHIPMMYVAGGVCLTFVIPMAYYTIKLHREQSFEIKS
jgi:hypothetical protein